MANQIRSAVALFILALVLFLIGNNLHGLWDRDEPRYAVATREMIASGDWIIPHFNGEIRYDKPVLIYWLMSAGVALFGENEFGVRFNSALMGALRVALIFLLALRLGATARGAYLAALIAALSSLLALISKAATIDSTLVIAVVCAMWLYWEQRTSGFCWLRHVVFWALLGLSLILKGPVGPAIVLTGISAFATWERFGRAGVPGSTGPGPALRLASGLLVMLAVALPWGILAWFSTDPPGDFLTHSVGKHVIERSKSEMEGHGGPFFYYVMLLPFLVFPFSGVCLNALRWGWSNRCESPVRLLWCWIIPSLIMFSAVKTKLPHYVAPLIPAIALMAALWWTEHDSPAAGADRIPSRRWWLVGGWFIIVVGLVAFLGLPAAVSTLGAPIPLLPVFTVGVLIFVTTLAGGLSWLRQEAEKSIVLLSAGWVIALVVALLWALPVADSLRPSRMAGLWIRANAPPETRLLMVEYDEPSLVFYGGRTFETLGRGERDKGFAILNDLQRPAALVTTSERWDKFRKDYKGTIEPRVSVRLKREAYYFEQGERMTIVVVGNWQEAQP